MNWNAWNSVHTRLKSFSHYDSEREMHGTLRKRIRRCFRSTWNSLSPQWREILTRLARLFFPFTLRATFLTILHFRVSFTRVSGIIFRWHTEIRCRMLHWNLLPRGFEIWEGFSRTGFIAFETRRTSKALQRFLFIIRSRLCTEKLINFTILCQTPR